MKHAMSFKMDASGSDEWKDMMVIKIKKQTPGNRIVTEKGVRLKRVAFPEFRVGTMEDDFINNCYTVVATSYYFRIPRIIKK